MTIDYNNLEDADEAVALIQRVGERTVDKTDPSWRIRPWSAARWL